MSLLAPPPSSTSIYENGGQRHGGEMETLSAPTPVQRRYTLNEEFHDVLTEVGAVKDKAYEWKDIIMLFIRYLANRKPSLLDPQNKSRVLCADDPIGRVFGVDCFTKEETRLLVRRQVSLVEDERLFAGLPPLPPLNPSCPPADVQSVKRGPAEDSGDDPDRKRSRPEAEATAAGGGGGPSAEPAAAPAQLHRMDTLELTDGDVGGGADGVGGAPVNATDDEYEVDDEDDHRKTYACEMEPVECTDVSDSDCSSGESDIDSTPQLTVLTWAEDFGMMADMETSESESELRDTWTCQAADCQHANSAKKSRCDRCWKTRPSWVVGPRRKKRRQRDLARLSKASRAPAVLCQTDGSVGSQDTGYGSQEMCSTASSSSSPPPPSPPPPSAADQTCLICCEKRRDAAIIHGRTGCQVTCYGCARKLWKKRDLCPSCRRTIEKIVFMRFG